VRDIAKQFKVHPYTVRRLARRKKIPASDSAVLAIMATVPKVITVVP
jgi:hypothetical protein